MRTERIDYIDTLRGLAIYCIVLGHFTQLAGDFYLFVFSFHVQLFFFISGLFAYKYSDFRSAAAHVVHSILFPYIFLSVFNALFFMVYDRQGPAAFLQMLLEALLGRRNNIFCANLWFFPCLAVMIMLYALIRNVIGNPVLRTVLCFAVSLAVRIFKEEAQWIWSADSALMFLFFYSLGDLLSPYVLQKKQIGIKGKEIWLKAGYIMSSVFALVWYAGYDNLCAMAGFDLPVVMDKVVYFAAAVELIMFMLGSAYYLRRAELINKLGRATLIIASTEQMMRLIVKSVCDLLGVQYHLAEPIQVLIYAFIITCLCYYLFAVPFARWFPSVFSWKRQTQE